MDADAGGAEGSGEQGDPAMQGVGSVAAQVACDVMVEEEGGTTGVVNGSEAVERGAKGGG